MNEHLESDTPDLVKEIASKISSRLFYLKEEVKRAEKRS